MVIDRLFLEDDRALEVVALMRQRGLDVAHAAPRDSLFLPAIDSRPAAEEFYGLMKHYSFRLLLRDVIQFQDDLRPELLTRFVDSATVSTYLDVLRRLGMVQPHGDRFILPGGPVGNFGGTLEWFVARVLTCEFSVPALYGVRLKNTASGGDYDVIGVMSGRLVYVETKSSPPKHIEDREILVFLRRLVDLKPDLAIFLVDTNLRMLDKVVRMFEGAISGGELEGLTPRARTARPQRLEREIFHLGRRLFLTNSKHELVANLRECLRAYHAAAFDLNAILGSAAARGIR